MGREGGGGGGWQQTRQRYNKAPTSKIYSTWTRILSDHKIFCTLRGGRKSRGLMSLGLFLLNILRESFTILPKPNQNKKRRRKIASLKSNISLGWRVMLAPSVNESYS